ncbi:MAG: terminase, partial [Rickettsiales bacterium]
PGVKYDHNWHIDLIADYLTKAADSKIKRLIINIPPRSLKSTCVSVAWPAWLLARNPSARIMCASYSQILSIKHSTDTRLLISSEWYRDNYPNVKITYDQNEKSKFTTTKRGFRFATSIGGTATGEGGDFLIIDDPHNPVQASSQIKRQNAIDWFEQTFISRLDDKRKGVIVIVMQRLHEDDLTGHLMKKSPNIWQNLKLPIIADSDQDIIIGKKKIYLKEGDILHKNRDNIEDINQLKIELGDYAFSAQYMQSPISATGNILKREWIRYYDKLPDVNRIIQSWDTAIKATSNSDYSVCTVWAECDDGYYLIDLIRDRYEYPNLKKSIITLSDKYITGAILIEDKASGQSLIQDLKYSNLPIISIKPIQDKITRFARVTSFFESSKVFIPSNSIFTSDYIKEILSFPNSLKDDQVDSTSQFLNWMINNKNITRIRNLD